MARTGRPREFNETTDSIEYDGYKWNRYPGSSRRDVRVYYRTHIGKKVEFLHRYIWKKHYGPIPEGCHIHHIDGNPLNNDISNLQCLSTKEHAAEHPWDDEHRAAVGERMRGDSECQNKCREWHRSPEGHEWHVQHGKDVAANLQFKEYTCQHCGKVFEVKSSHPPKFCSNNCKSAARRASGVDNESRICEICGKEFIINRYARTRCCSRKCSTRLKYGSKCD
ncbi:MAG: HNH endonuclease [Candidatus Methanomethylophilaceae archaeon]|nr:HNH endonuclease [Candidatus Methanomethylophilaceae archaeon]